VARTERDTGLTYQDFLKTGPDTLAGRYLRTFWHPVHRSDDLPVGRAKPIRIMSEDFTLFRGASGVAHAVAFRCAHRGTQLSTGWVEGDELRCFYHGWKYDGSGQCTEQPAEPEPFCMRTRIRSYPTLEYLGLIFVYQGEGEPPPFPYLPEFDNDFLHEVRTSILPTNFFTQLDNSMDTLHTTFVHPQFGRGEQRLEIGDVPCGVATYPSGETPGYPNYFVMPNASEFAGPPSYGEEVWSYQHCWRVPVDDHHYARFDLRVIPLRGQKAAEYRARQARNRGKGWGPAWQAAAEVIEGRMTAKELPADRPDLVNCQDLVAQMALGPIADETPQEHLGRSDVGVIAMRRLWARELMALAEGRPLTQWKRPDRLWEKIWAEGELIPPP
jgi:5,5'-dehydrodivanillate O-demethylase